MAEKVQVSESIPLGVILAFSGGFMDAYTYFCRGGVFANAQTGNMLLFGVNISKGDFGGAMRYIIPVVLFSLGIFISEAVRNRLKENQIIHWRQIVILAEAVILAFAAVVPLNFNLFSNAMVSMACGIQVESFRKINGNGVATTMCIGNLRAATEAFCDYSMFNMAEAKRKFLIYYGVVIIFILGAVAGNFAVGILGRAAIIISSFILLAGFLMMFKKR